MQQVLVRKCRCGKVFRIPSYPQENDNPMMYQCQECNQKDNWFYHMRMLNIDADSKIYCIKCGWRLGYNNSESIDIDLIQFHCKCCGLTFEIRHREPGDYYY